MNISNKISYIVIGMVLALSASVLAATWQGTTWISSGNIIDAVKMKANFDYLYERSWNKEGSNIAYRAGGIKGVSVDLSGKGTSAVTVASDAATTMVTKGFVDSGITNVTNIANAKAPTPNTLCTGNSYLQWNGTSFSCKTIVIPAQSTPKCNLSIQSAWEDQISLPGPAHQQTSGSTGYNGAWSKWIRTGKGASPKSIMTRFNINCL